MKRKRRKTDEINPKNVDCVKGKKISPFFFLFLFAVSHQFLPRMRIAEQLHKQTSVKKEEENVFGLLSWGLMIKVNVCS